MSVKEVGLLGEGRLTHRDMFSYTTEESKPAWRVLHKVSQFREDLALTSVAPNLSAVSSLLFEED